MASTSLMGGALVVAFNGQQSMAMPVAGPDGSGELITASLDDTEIPRGDLIQPETGPAPSRQVLRVSTIMRDGERDLVRVRPFARVSAPLVSSAADVVDRIPDFDPLRIFADANVESTDGMRDTLYGADVDGQMTMRVTEFPVDDRSMAAESPSDVATIEASVREAAQFLDGTNVQVAALPLVDPTRFDFGFSPQGSFEQYGVRIIPENVSFVRGSDENAGEAASAYSEEKVVTIGDGDNLPSVLTSNEATDEEAGEIAIRFRRDFSVSSVETGDKLRIVLAPAGDESGRFRPVRVSLYREANHIGTVALSDHDGYVAAEEPRIENDDLFSASGEIEANDAPRPRLYESLYQTALANRMSPQLIDELVRIYSFDLDFNTRVAPGDSIEVVYSLDEDESESADVTEIVYTSVTVAGKTRRYYRYRAPDDGSVDYYDEQGNSAKKFLLRKPMSGGTFRSGYGARTHPLLGYVKMHTGVDWAAPPGTPIMAAGDGVVVYADWKSGYGNFIKLRHNNGYETAYAHQTRFASGIREGARVRQGQVIGYVGSTGLSTGPHLHYEVQVNGNFVDPMRIKLPKGRALDGDVLATFESERERIDTLLGVGAPAKLADAGTASGG
ncbi:M23 family metallopeptidase [Chthonobacter albigriseus]|uniref:M23 family metallopeptidase n=1 Tax=Chthonobacter albigriseus TaxID=1683161 RepID=UPI0015EF5CE4|nr:M23 family metallopeptidase [Chthonobacter albigriseus]